MTPLAPMPFPETSFALMLMLLLIAPVAIAGLALVNAGLGRSRSAAQSLLGTLVVISTAVLAFVLVGWAIASGSDRDIAIKMAGRSWDLVGAGRLLGLGVAEAPAREQLVLLFEVLSVALGAMIPW